MLVLAEVAARTGDRKLLQETSCLRRWGCIPAPLTPVVLAARLTWSRLPRGTVATFTRRRAGPAGQNTHVIHTAVA